MGMNSYTFNFKRLPWSCIGAILIIILIQFALASNAVLQNTLFLFTSPSKSDPLRIHYFLNQAKKDKGKKVFLLGTSQSREGFDVHVLNDHFKKNNITFYNMGAAAYSGIDLYMEIDRILDAKPDLIAYMPYVGNFYLDYDFKRLKYYYHPKIIPFLLKRIEHKPLFENRWFLFDAYLSKISYFFKYREEFKPIFYKILDYLVFRRCKTIEAEYFHYSKNVEPKYFEEQRDRFKGKKFYFSQYTEAEQEAFHKTVRIIKKNNSQFIVIDAPNNPRIRSVCPPKIENAYEAFLTKLLSNEGILFVRKKDLPDFTMDQFIDFTHLNATGRAILTNHFIKYFETHYRTLIKRDP